MREGPGLPRGQAKRGALPGGSTLRNFDAKALVF
jgi:hypothetical protein